jgi:SP family general alpha glucoside:H+ symporter-like MFS transporter
MGNALDFIKIPIEIKEHAPSTTGSGDKFVQLGREANEDDHNVGKMESFRIYPWACGWCVYAVWVVLLVSFENQAAGNVIGIP